MSWWKFLESFSGQNLFQAKFRGNFEAFRGTLSGVYFDRNYLKFDHFSKKCKIRVALPNLKPSDFFPSKPGSSGAIIWPPFFSNSVSAAPKVSCRNGLVFQLLLRLKYFETSSTVDCHSTHVWTCCRPSEASTALSLSLASGCYWSRGYSYSS